MSAARSRAGRQTIIAAGDATVEEIPGKNERLCVSGPRRTYAGPGSPRAGATTGTSTQAATIVAFKKSQARSSAHRIYTRRETVATETHLPRSRTSRAAGKSNGTWTIVLSASSCCGCGGIRKVSADIAGVEFNRAQSVVHIYPGVSCGP